MAINKVIYYGEVLVDMSNVTVTPETLCEGVTALDASGALIVGTNTGISDVYIEETGEVMPGIVDINIEEVSLDG